jgi:hypothetical protein
LGIHDCQCWIDYGKFVRARQATVLSVRRDIGWVWRWTLPPAGSWYDWAQLAADRLFVEQLIARMQHFFQMVCVDLNAPEACLLAARPAKDSSGFSQQLEVSFHGSKTVRFTCIEDSEDVAPVPLYDVIMDFLIDQETHGDTGDYQLEYTGWVGFVSLEKWRPKMKGHTSTKRPEYADFKYCTRHDLFTKRVIQV